MIGLHSWVSGGQACLRPSAAERKNAKRKINVYGISSSVKSCYEVCLFVVAVTSLKFLATQRRRSQLKRRKSQLKRPRSQLKRPGYLSILAS